MGETWYREITDDSGHRYVIPVERADDWWEWVASAEAEEGATPPEWATEVDGGNVQFTTWRIG